MQVYLTLVDSSQSFTMYLIYPLLHTTHSFLTQPHQFGPPGAQIKDKRSNNHINTNAHPMPCSVFPSFPFYLLYFTTSLLHYLASLILCRVTLPSPPYLINAHFHNGTHPSHRSRCKAPLHHYWRTLWRTFWPQKLPSIKWHERYCLGH